MNNIYEDFFISLKRRNGCWYLLVVFERQIKLGCLLEVCILIENRMMMLQRSYKVYNLGCKSEFNI